jgi:CRISPR-associated protein Csb2
MSLVIEQYYPLGRFHATRWNQSPFEDPFGEWPPSPWRFLRALAARSFQYERETGAPPEARDRLLNSLAQAPPSFFLPPASARGLALKQFQHRGCVDGCQ